MKSGRLTRRWKIVLLTWIVTLFLYAAYAKLQFDAIHGGEFHGHQFGLFPRAYKSYLEQHDGAFPPMDDSDAFSNAVGQEPIFANKPPEEVKAQFVDAARGKPYHLNPWLQGKRINDLPHPDRIVTLYEDAFPWKNAFFSTDYRVFRGVLYADGHGSVIRERQWPQIKAQSHVP